MMCAAYLPDVIGISPFDCSDTTGVASKWKRWIRAFDLFATGKGVTDPDQKKALLLHSAGMQVQDVYFTMTEVEGGENDTSYDKTVNTLKAYFQPQSNVPYERHVFRNLSQDANETVDQFITRLRQQSETCDFGTPGNVNEQLRDQVIEKCSSHHLRRKLLEKGRALTLDQVRNIARAMEESERQARSIENLEVRQNVNKLTVREKSGPTKTHTYKKLTCYACGYDGHTFKDPKCPAKGKQCRKCKGYDHFEQVCKSKPPSRNMSNFRPRGRGSNVRGSNVNYVHTGETEEENDSMYAFSVWDNDEDCSRLPIDIGGVPVNMIIDSGASCNVVDRNQWEYLKMNSVKCVSTKTTKRIYPYGSTQPLSCAGTFTAEVTVGGDQKLENVEFVVIEGEGQPLLGRDTALKLGILKLGPVVNSIHTERSDRVAEKYPECFQGVGKLKDFQLSISIDKEVKPVVQPTRRIPFHLRDKVSAKLKELEDLDIIEKVDGPSSWVSPVVVVPKAGGKDIRLCVDMRQANQAVRRERYPIPTVDEVFQDLNQGKIFSKLDIKWAYHQIELDEESREITTFTTHEGLYRYKRLMFGISSAPEQYQKVLTQVLQGCGGVRNIFDDIIVHGSTEEEHNARLDNVVRVLRDKGLTLNLEKCELNMSHVVFMGHMLSERGIGPAESKVKAVRDARKPETAAEVRSFLGLVNYSACFIPDLATISAPLRELIKKDVPFRWEHEQQDAFRELKHRLSSAETLAYFDKSAPTKVIADASPVGLGAVLVQEQQGEFRVVYYASRSLSDTEKRYSQTEKEALGLVWACERFHMYLYGSDFELCTDHKPLECIYAPKSKPCARIERWVLRMQPYNYTVRYIPGRQNIADALSRLTVEPSACTSSETSEAYVRFVAEEATPVAMTTREIERASEHDPELIAVRECLLTGKWDTIEYKQYLPVRTELCAIGMLVLRGTRIVVPSELRDRVKSLGHEGHPGVVGMKTRLRAKVWWPGIDKEVEKHCKSCYGCQLVGQPTKPEPMKRTELPTAPWADLAADLLGPLPSGDYIFVVVDYYSRFFELRVTKSTTSEKITSMLTDIFTTHGLPRTMKTDNGPQVVSEQFRNFMEENGIEHRKSTPLWPQANGEVERQNRSIMKRIRIAQAEGKDWKSDLNNYLVLYRSTPHSTTGVSPAKMLFGREIRTKLPELSEFRGIEGEARDRDCEMKEKGKVYADKRRNACESDIREGDTVLVKQDRENKLSTPFAKTPVKVVSKNGNSVVVESGQGVRYQRNVTRVKKFVESNTSGKPVLDHTIMSDTDKYDDTDSETQDDLSGVALEFSNSNKTNASGQNCSAESDKPVVRPRRQINLPARFSDYVIGHK